MDVVLGLRRVPAGFYTVVCHSGLEWRTENKCSSVKDDVIEWSRPIPLPSDPSVTICLEVYASFEFQPMLGTGEQLRELQITVEQLLDRSANDVRVWDRVLHNSLGTDTVEKKCERSNSPDRIITSLLDHGIPRRTGGRNKPWPPLSRYRKHGGRQDLERCIAEFERALNDCSLGPPYRAAAQSNLAMAKFILCQIEDTSASLQDPTSLYRIVLLLSPYYYVQQGCYIQLQGP
ncbi:hypothetical protein EV363DRAFT_1401026 [Boletus edulis]|nr:hypothetical protein EV363DRAFT_1401026 [Boletus edulis]